MPKWYPIVQFIFVIVAWAIGAYQGYSVGYKRGLAGNGPGQ